MGRRNQIATYYRQGGPIRVVLKGIEDALGDIQDVLNIVAREHRYWNEYPLPIRDRFRAWRHGFLSRSYVLLELDENDPAKYLSDYQQGTTVWGGVNSSYADVLKNKVAFALATEPYIDCVPTVFGTIESGRFIPQPNTNGGSTTDLVTLLLDESSIIVKPIAGYGGDDVYLVEHCDDVFKINGQIASRSRVANLEQIVDDSLVVEFVKQHNYAATIAPESTNTIRILTIKDLETSEIFVPQAIHRFGSIASAPADNWSGGGFAAPVNVEQGELGRLVRYSTETGLERFDQHPETKAQVQGESIPRWDEVIETVCEIAEIHQQMPYVGWDVVVTDDGPMVLEGNCAPHTELMQLGGGLFEDDRVRRAFEQF